jgi:four helix bundle protein
MEPQELEERTFEFGVAILKLAQCLKHDLPEPVINELVQSGVGIGAEVIEARHAGPAGQVESYSAGRRACRQTSYWLRIIASADESQSEKVAPLLQEIEHLARGLKMMSARVKQRIEFGKPK